MFPSQLYPLREGEESQPGRDGIAGLRLSQGLDVFIPHITFESLCLTVSYHLGPQISSCGWEMRKPHQVENSIWPCNRARATVPPTSMTGQFTGRAGVCFTGVALESSSESGSARERRADGVNPQPRFQIVPEFLPFPAM